MSRIVAYCSKWHLAKSGAFRELLVKPLMPFHEIELREWETATHDELSETARACTVVFCQVLPPLSWLGTVAERVVWIPMWDAVIGYSDAFWKTLPRALRIVALSQKIAARATSAGLRTLTLQFFLDATRCPESGRSTGRVAFYWNRSGLVGPEFLRRFCKAVNVERILFLNAPDPVAEPRLAYELPLRLGHTVVEPIAWSGEHERYLAQVERANIFIAPRALEGVGVSLLEAMARGCAVVAFDAPTMNEYVMDGSNGLLLRSFGCGKPRELAVRTGRRIAGVLARSFSSSIPLQHTVTVHQNWKSIGSADYEALGRQARSDHKVGFAKWQKRIPAYAAFLSEDAFDGNRCDLAESGG